MTPLFIFVNMLLIFVYYLEVKEVNDNYHVVKKDQAKLKLRITFVILFVILNALFISYLL